MEGEDERGKEGVEWGRREVSGGGESDEEWEGEGRKMGKKKGRRLQWEEGGCREGNVAEEGRRNTCIQKGQ